MRLQDLFDWQSLEVITFLPLLGTHTIWLSLAKFLKLLLLLSKDGVT